MKAVLSSILILVAGTALAGEDGAGGGLPAFPGAEGYGAAATGGRGGRVIYVTNLNSKGPGSLSEACAAEGPRIVAFKVGGVIKAPKYGKYKKIIIKHPNITIAGQTAPSPGITIEGMLSTQGVKGLHDVVVRFIRVRARTAKAGNIRTIEFNGGSQYNMILDHCSLSWGSDDTCSMSGPHHITVQWCAVEESDVHLEGGDEPHNFGMMFGTYGKGFGTLHHTLFAHHHERCPLIGADPTDFRNNVLYNVGTGFGSHPYRMNYRQKGKRFDVNQVGNYSRWGRGSIMGSPRLYHPPTTVCRPHIGPGKSTRAYCSGNYFDWAGGYRRLGDKYRTGMDKPHATLPVETQTAEEAYELVLAHAGCVPRDAVSRRTMREVATRTGLWGRDEPDGGLLEGLPTAKAPADSDKDGMPDEWEKARGLNPADSKDAGKVVPKGASPGDRHAGYTYVEYYMNEIADRRVARALTAYRLRREALKPWGRPAKRLSYEIKPLAELVKLVVEQNMKRKQTDTKDTWYAIQALSRMGVEAKGGVPELVAALETEDVRTACFAAWAIGAIGPPAKEAAPALIKALGRPWPVKNSKWNFNPAGFIAWALGRIGPEARAAVPALVKTAAGKDSWARRPAIWALKEIGAKDERTVTALVAALENDGHALYNTQRHAVEALAGIGETAVPALRKALGGGSANTRRAAAEALGGIGEKAGSASPDLLKLLGAAEPVVRVAALRALPRVNPKGAGVIAGIARLLGDEQYGVRSEAAKALGACGASAAVAVPALVKALGDKRREVRRSAALAMGRIGAKAVPALAEACSSEDVIVRKYAARALGAVSADESVAALVKALGDKSAEVRREAVWSLGRIGPAAKSGAKALKKAGSDPDHVIRFASPEALKPVGS